MLCHLPTLTPLTPLALAHPIVIALWFRGIAQLSSRTLVLVTAQNEILDDPQQQQKNYKSRLLGQWLTTGVTSGWLTFMTSTKLPCRESSAFECSKYLPSAGFFGSHLCSGGIKLSSTCVRSSDNSRSTQQRSCPAGANSVNGFFI